MLGLPKAKAKAKAELVDDSADEADENAYWRNFSKDHPINYPQLAAGGLRAAGGPGTLGASWAWGS